MKRNSRKHGISKEFKEERNRMISILRYHTTKPKTDNKVYASYSSIAKLMNISYQCARQVCIAYIVNEVDNNKKKDNRRVLE